MSDMDVFAPLRGLEDILRNNDRAGEFRDLVIEFMCESEVVAVEVGRLVERLDFDDEAELAHWQACAMVDALLADLHMFAPRTKALKLAYGMGEEFKRRLEAGEVDGVLFDEVVELLAGEAPELVPVFLESPGALVVGMFDYDARLRDEFFDTLGELVREAATAW